jgi:hypothetical protein
MSFKANSEQQQSRHLRHRISELPHQPVVLNEPRRQKRIEGKQITDVTERAKLKKPAVAQGSKMQASFFSKKGFTKKLIKKLARIYSLSVKILYLAYTLRF